MNLLTNTEPVYAMRGELDPLDILRHQPRPTADRAVGYTSIDPGTPTPTEIALTWHKLGAAHRPEDELAHRFYRESMDALVASTSFFGGRAFYPDEAGVLVARLLMETSKGPTMLWVGYNVRAVYVAGALALASTADALLPEHMRG